MLLWFIFLLFFPNHKTPALAAKDLNFIIITEVYSSMRQVNNFFVYPWSSSTVPYADFVYFYVANGQYDKIILPDNNFYFYPFYLVKKYHSDTLLLSYSHYKGAILLFYNDPNPKLLDVWQKNMSFKAVLPSPQKSFHPIRVFYKNEPLTVFIVRQPTYELKYKFVDFSDDIAFMILGKRFFIIHKYKDSLNLLVLRLLTNIAKGTDLIFAKNKRPRFKSIKTKYFYDNFLLKIDNLIIPVAISDSAMVEYTDMDTLAIAKIYYATKNNFASRRFYPCPRCLLRYKVAKNLLKASKEFYSLGYRLVLYDCYRPFSVQKSMWEAFPNHYYLAPPNHGSMHNRGMAVDISLADMQGKELDMGTGFDFFGPQAHPDYPFLPVDVKNSRLLLRKIMKKYGFLPINTEWWHFSYRKMPYYKILNFWWNCE